MSDMTRAASLLEVSSKLQTASNCLKHLNEKGPNSYEKSVLEWTGKLLIQIDWDTKFSKKEFNASMVFQAASTRPNFYGALMRISPKLNEIGVKSAKDLSDFLKGLFRTLESGGSKPQLTGQRLYVASDFLGELSKNLLSELSNNGLPKQKLSLMVGAMN